ncbi:MULTISPECIES: hypothetical protein [unclassified Psychrobacillus]|uniref:hypothetical protein n=1 Tax=unclassified Psychrobacillus TaxID=2636677 RepID=UPI0030FC9E13
MNQFWIQIIVFLAYVSSFVILFTSFISLAACHANPQGRSVALSRILYGIMQLGVSSYFMEFYFSIWFWLPFALIMAIVMFSFIYWASLFVRTRLELLFNKK